MPPWTRTFVHEMNLDRCRSQSKLADESQLLRIYGFDEHDSVFTLFDSRAVDSTSFAIISTTHKRIRPSPTLSDLLQPSPIFSNFLEHSQPFSKVLKVPLTFSKHLCAEKCVATLRRFLRRIYVWFSFASHCFRTYESQHVVEDPCGSTSTRSISSTIRTSS